MLGGEKIGQWAGQIGHDGACLRDQGGALGGIAILRGFLNQFEHGTLEMPFIGIGLHLLVAIFFAVHAIRTGRDMYWILILLMFPLLGSIIYFMAVYLPESRIQQGVHRTVNRVAKSLDPGRELREASAAYDMTPTAQNQMRLANAFLEMGEAGKAATHFESCLNGPFAKDPEIRFGAAGARLQNGDGAAAINLLSSIRQENPGFMEEKVSLLFARAHELVGNQSDAQYEFMHLNEKFGSLESKIEYAIWAGKHNMPDIAQGLRDEVSKAVKHMPKHARALNRPLLNRLDTAFERLPQSK